jgi:replication factor A2
VKQFNHSTQAHPDADWMFENTELGHVRFLPGLASCFLSNPTQVRLVAHVITVHKQATNCVYTLSDGTGDLEARHWSDAINQDDGDSQDEIK